MTIERVVEIISAEPVLPGNVFKILGFWKGLWCTLYMVAHPYKSARVAAMGMRIAILKSLKKATLEDLQKSA